MSNTQPTGPDEITHRRPIIQQPYATPVNPVTWMSGVPSIRQKYEDIPSTIPFKTQRFSGTAITDRRVFTSEAANNKIENPNDIPNSITQDNINIRSRRNAMFNLSVRRQMLNDDTENIQNDLLFPIRIRTSHLGTYEPARYDYKILVNDSRYPVMHTLEDKLAQARAVFGLPVHGNPDIARAMKYYMYNRFQTPDTNMAHNKSVTYVFFTRPDCFLLDHSQGACKQAVNHTESAMIWKRNPDLFKLLTDASRCKDSDNFNFLLSNQISSFDFKDENLHVEEVGKTWAGHSISYGEQYTGRTSGELSCGFTETNDYSIINLVKLWISYIHNVARGIWSPSYNLLNREIGRNWQLNDSHVFTRTIDYAASVYVFKCGPDGESVLYWSKYFGVFPTNTGSAALSWDKGTLPGEFPRLNINFKYSFKRDLSPISLLEFNHCAGIKDTAEFVSSYNPEYGHSDRPFVGTPYIEMNLFEPHYFPQPGGTVNSRSTIRLKFKPRPTNPTLRDDTMYRSNLAQYKGSGIEIGGPAPVIPTIPAGGGGSQTYTTM